MTELVLRPGDILLTSSVGGVNAKWRDVLLSKAIIHAQAAQTVGFTPSCSHAELITNYMGETFSARWRTRRRANGLADYIGSYVVIGGLVPEYFMSSPKFWLTWEKALMHRFDGDIYPVHRILLQGLGAYVLPRWVTKLGAASMAVCSEVVACFFNAYGLPGFEAGWRGWTPADLEREVVRGDCFYVKFKGVLTEKIMNEGYLPTYKKGTVPEGFGE